MVKRVFFVLLGIVFLVGCGSAPKTSKKHSQKRYAYYDGDAATQDSIEDLIYSELSKRQQAILKKYRVPNSIHSLAGVKFDIPMTMNDRVRDWIDYFANGSGRRHFARYLARSTRLVPTQLKILREYNLPKDLIFLSMIESGFNTHAYSSAAASGLWQFIRSTGRLYGLDSDYWIDERRDPEKATHAAARHLRDLYEEFGDWYLAFAAYNAGAGKIRRAIEMTGSRDFWVISETSYIRQETKDYVPKILAAAIISKSPDKYGFNNVDYQDPIATEKATVTSSTDVEVIAECAGVDADLIRLVNPELIRNMTPPNRSGYAINLPRGTKRSFESRYARLDASERLRNVRYVVERGDNLKSIARDHGITVASLMNANPSLKGRRNVSSGTSLIIPRAYESPPPVPVASSYPSTGRGNRLIDLIADNSDREKEGKGSKKKKSKEKETLSEEKNDGEMKVAWREKEKSKVDPFDTSMEKKLTAEAPEKSTTATDAAPGAPANPSSPATVAENSTGTSSDAAPTPAGPDSEAPSSPGEGPQNVDKAIQKSLEKVQGTGEDDTLAEGSVIRVKTSGEEPAAPKARENPKGKSKAQKVVQHRVKKGETLAAIANRYGVSVAQLRDWNRLPAKKQLQANQKLIVRLIDAVVKDAVAAPSPKEGVSRSGKGEKAKLALKKKQSKMISYKVKKGDTLSKIAKKYDVTPSEIVFLNGLSKKATLKPGLVLKIKTKSTNEG